MKPKKKAQSPRPAGTMKKKYGQHFLNDRKYLMDMFEYAELLPGDSVFEIGGGEGFLTNAILDWPIDRLWVFEIDPEWVSSLKKRFSDDRLTVFHQDILDLDFSKFDEHKPWILLANLPYNITFPLLYKFQEHRDIFSHGIILIQEEVAQKIVARRGRGYGYISLFFQWYFDWKLLNKVPPSAFYPPPKVDSRFLYFAPREDLPEIPKEEEFWKFIIAAFKQPRRNLKNNLSGTHYFEAIPEELHDKRAQQFSMEELLELWKDKVISLA